MLKDFKLLFGVLALGKNLPFLKSLAFVLGVALGGVIYCNPGSSVRSRAPAHFIATASLGACWLLWPRILVRVAEVRFAALALLVIVAFWVAFCILGFYAFK